MKKLIRHLLILLTALAGWSPLAALTLTPVRDVPVPDVQAVSAAMAEYNRGWTNLSNDQKKKRNQAVQLANDANKLQDQGKSQEAWDRYQQAYRLWPDLLETSASYAAICYSLKRYDEALKALQPYLSRYNGLDALAWRISGLANSGLKNWDQGVQDLSRAARLSKSDPAVLTEIAAACFAAGDFENARIAYDTALQAGPQDPVNWLGAGETSLRLRDLAAAERYFNSGLKAVPANADLAEGVKKVKLFGLVAKANALIAKQKFEDAVGVLREAVGLAPDHYLGFLELGKLCLRLGRMAEATNAFNRACGLKPDSGEAWFYLGSVARQTGDLDRAYECYSSAELLGQTGFDLWDGLGALYVQKGFYDKALEVLGRALKVRPQAVSALLNAGLAWYEKSEYQKAADYFSAALAEDRRNADAATNYSKAKAMALVQEGNRSFDAKDFPAALSKYQEALKLRKNFPDAEINEANAYIELGQAQNALSVLLPLYARNTNSYAVIESLAAVYDRSANPDKAREFSARLGGLQDRDPTVWYRLGLNYELNGRLEKAVQAYSNCLRIDPQFRKAVVRTAQVWYKLGIVEYNASRFDTALANLNRALAVQPDNPDVTSRIRFIRAFKIIVLAVADYKSAAYESSIGRYGEAEKVFPGIPETYFGLGQDRFELGQFSNAGYWLERCVAARSNFIDAYKLWGETLRKRGRYADASSVLGRAVGMSPRDAELFTSLGYVFYLNNDLENAKDMYRQAVVLNPSESEPHVNLGLVYFKEGDYATAEREFLTADSLKAGLDDVYFDLGLVYFKQNRFRDSERSLVRSIELDDSVPDKFFNLARTLYSMDGRVDEAVQNGLKSLQMRDDPRFHYGLGKIYEKKMTGVRPSETDRVRELAIAEYQTVIRMVPGTQLSAWAEERLRALMQDVRLIRLYRMHGTGGSSLLVDNGEIFSGSDDGSLSAFAPQSEDEDGLVWRFRSSSAFTAPAVLRGATLYAADSRNVFALDRGDGRLLWSRSIGEKLTSALIEAGGIAYAGGASGTWYAVTKDRISSLFSSGAPASGHPLVAGQILVASDSYGTVTGYDLAQNRVLWTYQTGGPLTADPVSWQNSVLIFGSDSKVHSLELGSGRRQWTFHAGAPFVAAGSIANNVLYCAAGRAFYALGPDGRMLWGTRLPEEACSVSAVNGRNNCFIGGRNASIFCVSVSDRRIRWRYRLEDTAGMLALSGDTAGYFSALDGSIHHLEFLK